MDRFLSLTLCLLAVYFPRGVDGTAFVLDEMTCSYPVNLYVENVKCGSSSGDACNFGDLLYVDGTVGLGVSLATRMEEDGDFNRIGQMTTTSCQNRRFLTSY